MVDSIKHPVFWIVECVAAMAAAAAPQPDYPYPEDAADKRDLPTPDPNYGIFDQNIDTLSGDPVSKQMLERDMCEARHQGLHRLR